jgi:hypothetical protein
MTFVDRFTVALPLLFLAALPPVGATESEFLARVAAVALALLEGFLAFPVAGSQRFWASLLIVPAGMLCLHDGARQLSPALAVTRRRWCRVGSILFATVLVLGGVAWSASVFVGNLSAEASTYNANTPTTLPGSHMIRLPAAQALTLESLSKAIHAQCSTFVTLPGMNSFYFWTEETPPTWFNTNSWFFLVNDAQQEKIVQRIEEKDRSRFCVVDNPDELFRWEVGAASPVPPLPLVRLVDVFEQENSPPKLFGGYQLFVSRGRAP